MTDGLLKHFDYYDLIARIFSALLCLLPPLLIFGLTAMALAKTLAESSVFVVVGLALLYFAGSIARSRGMSVEDRMLAEDGGWTSTFMLRHSDSRIDSVTKGRYHRLLERLCPGLKLPSPAEELADLSTADESYRSATKALIEKRRGKGWELLLQENAGYGFRRNMLGLKPVAIFLAALCMFVTGVYWWYQGGMPSNIGAAVAVADAWPGPLLLMGLDFFAILTWLAFVNRSWVRQGAMAYCAALFRTLDAT